MFQSSSRTPSCLAQAVDCRRHAAELEGKPEAPILLRIAGYFEEMATQSGPCAFDEPASAGVRKS